MISIDDQIELELLLRQEKAEQGVAHFWTYLQLKAPGFFTDDKVYLRNLADDLQAFYEGRIQREREEDKWMIVPTPNPTWMTCKKLMINLPPRHGKSRSIVEWCQWVLGKNHNERIIECSYNDDTAGDFAKFVKDGIIEENNTDEGYVFSDFFEDVKLKKGSSSYYKWALEGQHFNFLAAGIGGSITGKGGSILIIDDPIKLAEEAFNEERLEKIWNWYTGTFLSRGDAEDGQEPLEVIIMTRWAEGDICGRILNSEDAKNWYVIKLKAYNETTDQMLCEKVLSKQRYLDLQRKMDFQILNANYNQETVNIRGKLYQSFKIYDELPKDKYGKSLIREILNYTDTADEGTDFLCSINYGLYKGEAYILDILYTNEPMEKTELMTAKFFIDGKVSDALVESNNGGKGFARAVEKLIWEKYKSRTPRIRWFHQSANKLARIFTASAFVQEHIYFPSNWKDRFPQFYKSMNTFLREGKNKHDDAQDAITGVAEKAQTRSTIRFWK